MMHVDSKAQGDVMMIFPIMCVRTYGKTQMHNAREATVVFSLLGNLLLKSVFIDP